MENIEEKYKKLATEYSKLRAQAGVLKRAVLEEQNKNGALRETLRVKETNLRRVEQEVDSLGFRNKQLEHRVANLQDDLNSVGKNSKPKGKLLASHASPAHQSRIEPSSVLSEEFQNKIFECAQLTSSLADKCTEMQLQSNRIEELENLIRSMNTEQTDIEAKLRKEVERLTVKMHDMETKYTEASSIVGSDDTLYVSDCEQQQLQQQQKFISNTNNNNINQNGKVGERIAELEKEVIHWRSQCEILKVTDKLKSIDTELEKIKENKTTEKIETDKELTPRELVITEHFLKKIEESFRNKCIAESKLALFIDECDSLRKHLDILNDDLKFQDRMYRESQRNLQLTDEDLATTRINYEEQISVLTEQVISLSDQLAELR